jgi:hypothetical protein
MPESESSRDDEWRNAMNEVGEYLHSPPSQTRDGRIGMSLDIDHALSTLTDIFDCRTDTTAAGSQRGQVDVFELVWRCHSPRDPALADIHRDFLLLFGQLPDDRLVIRRTVDDRDQAVVFHVLAGTTSHSHPLQFRIIGPDVERVLDWLARHSQSFRRDPG